MKQNFILLIILSVCFAGCKSNPTQAEIKGEIKGLGNDTIYLYSDDEFSEFIEAIPVADDKFSLTVDMDTTLIQTKLFISDREQYPLYLERGKTIQVKGNTAQPGVYDVKGNKTNEELTDFMEKLPSTNPTDTMALRLVEEYMRLNHQSLINIYLLEKYFVEIPSPNLPKIKELIGFMDGSLQDKPYVERLTKLIEENEKSEVNKTAPIFSLPNMDGKRISRSEFRDQYLLLTFWASWSDTCRAYNKEIKSLYKMYPPKTKREKERDEREKNNRNYKKAPELAIVGISLDLDKQAWQEAVKQDTLKWEQLNDFTGWNSPVVTQYAINEIPYNILMDSRGRILARGIQGKQLEHKLDSLLKQTN